VVGSDDEIWVNVRVNRKLWRQFQERCTAADAMPSEVLVALLETYLAAPSCNGAIAPPAPSDDHGDRHIRKVVADYLQQNLESQVVKIVERHFSPPPGERPTQSFAPPDPPRSRPPNSDLKSARELAEILGVSPPYITTLNRLGELHKRGWKDSGVRRGKTILYQRISPS
jgi:hypothetical protein